MSVVWAVRKGGADDFVAARHLFAAAHFDSDGAVEFERASACGRLRRPLAVAGAYLRAELVDEDDGRVAFRYGGGEAAQRVAHEARVKADLLAALVHPAVYLGLRRERGDGVDDYEVDRAAADEGVEDVEGLFAAVRLREVEVRGVDAERGGEARIERVLRVYEGRYAAGFLRFGEDVERDGGFTAALRAEDFDYASARDASDAERHVERQYAAVYDLDGALHFFAIVQPPFVVVSFRTDYNKREAVFTMFTVRKF